MAGFCLLLVLFAARLGDTSVRKTLTVDEPHYIGRGLYLWATEDYDFAASLSLHPPLTFHLASVPLLFMGLEDLPRERSIGRLLFEREKPGVPALRVAARLPFLLLSCWGAALCFLWAREVAGAAAGIFAVFLYTFSPTVLAYGALAHSDITVTVFFLQTLYALWRWLMKPTPLRLVLVGLSLGLALISKISALLLLGGVAGVFAVVAFRLRSPRPTLPLPGPDAVGARVGFAALSGLVVLVLAIGVIWAGYGFSFRISTLDSGPFADIPLPSYVLSLLFDRMANSQGRNVYFLGEIATGGWWYYFPVAFSVKVPLAIIGLLSLAVVAPSKRPAPLGWLIAIPVSIYLAIALFWLDIPLGIRYLLPIFPLMFVFVATQLIPLAPGWRRVATLGLCAWLALASLRTHPDYLSYFNEAAGGPARGHRILLDSNVDWGQDLGTLAEYLATRGNPPVWLAFFGFEKPLDHGIRSFRLKGCRPVHGIVAISANVRAGLYKPFGQMGEPKPGCYDWLDAYEPVALVGDSIFVYEIPAGGGLPAP